MGSDSVGDSAHRAGRLRLVAAIGLLGVPLLVGLILAVWALRESPLHSAEPEQPLVAQIGAAERRDSVPVALRLVEARPYPVVSQSSGIVTALSLSVGKAVSTGQTVLAVDGLPVVAYVAPSPLYRDIGPGLSGDDVTVAQQFLQEMGYLGQVDGRVGDATVRAIREFNAAQALPHGDVLLTSSLLWIPLDSAEPHEITVRVGQRIEPQTELYSTVSGQDQIVVDTAPAPVERMVGLGAERATLPEGQSIIADPNQVAALKEAFGEESTATGTVEGAVPRQVGTLPASAVVVDQRSHTCFFPGVSGEGIRIKAESGSFGLVDVDPALVGQPVLVNPRSTREDLSCGS